MSDRRFTDKPDLYPEAVRGLEDYHPAMTGNRTVYPSTVVTVTRSSPVRLLVSGENNRKLGATVEKGAFKGYAIYSLSLEERATCPEDCAVRSVCYGNAMQLARRHRIKDSEVFYDRIHGELKDLCADHKGVLVRLHVLGDFPSVEYVSFWKEMLDEYPNLACYGYTARRTKNWDGDEIGDAIQAVKDAHPDRFRIRWSSPVARPDGAIVANVIPRQKRINDGIVCPAQTDATACCATCALCWEPAAKHDTIAFVLHGLKSKQLAAEQAMRNAEIAGAAPQIEARNNSQNISPPPALPAPAKLDRPSRYVQPLPLPSSVEHAAVTDPVPEVRMVHPYSLLIEASYQRDLTRKSVNLIKRIVAGWNWSKFKPPIVAETADGLFVIDGQHTAIAAATHEKIDQIPVLIVSADHIEKRAESFVSHNRDRIPMSPLQVFHAEVVAGDRNAEQVLAAITSAGASVPRSAPPKGTAKPGQIVAINELRRLHKHNGDKAVYRVARIATLSGIAPIGTTVIIGLRYILLDKRFERVRALGDEAIARAMGSISNIEATSQYTAAETGQNRYRACALLIEKAALEMSE